MLISKTHCSQRDFVFNNAADVNEILYYNSRKELDVCIIIDFLLTNEIAKLSLKCQGLLMNAVSMEKREKKPWERGWRDPAFLLGGFFPDTTRVTAHTYKIFIILFFPISVKFSLYETYIIVMI